MMKILVINGSPKGKGNTYKVAQKLEAAMKRIDNTLEFQYMNLKDMDLRSCIGCYRCLADGENNCPLKDDRSQLEAFMELADGVVFATPVYVANVSGMFKNFLDRFAYICHRPRFHGKKALVLSSTGSLGTGIVNMISKMSVETWGFEVAASLGAITSPAISREDEVMQWLKIEKNSAKAAKKFLKALKNTKKVRARFFKLYAFRLQKASFGNADRLKADFNYWKSKGWLEKDCAFYINAKINPVVRFAANLFADIKIKHYPKSA
jgi:multimeric flavodoxin WrbA